MITDDPIRELERQLVNAAARESGAEAGGRMQQQHGRVFGHRRMAAGLSIAATVCVVMLAGLPLGLFEGGDTRSSASILRTAAALAADQPINVSGYRYTKLLDRQTYTVTRDARRASVTLEQPSEQWVDRTGRGRQILQASRIVARSGDPTLQAALPSALQAPGTQPYPSTGVVRSPVPLNKLPSDADALLQTLSAGYRDGRISPDGSRPSAKREPYQLTTLILFLLGDANVTPHQRGALFEALDDETSATSLGTVADERGRKGQGVSITTRASDPLPGASFKVIYDPATSALLSWTATNKTVASQHGALAQRTHILIRADQVDTPDGRP